MSGKPTVGETSRSWNVQSGNIFRGIVLSGKRPDTVGVTPLEFRRNIWHQKTRIPALFARSCV